MNCVVTEKQETTAREYWDFVHTCLSVLSYEDNIGVFSLGLNEQRIKLHREMCEAWGLEELDTAYITDNLDRLTDFGAFLEKLYELKKTKWQKPCESEVLKNE